MADYLTVAEFARWMRVHPETVRRWLRSGHVKGTLLGDRAGWRIPVTEQTRLTSVHTTPSPERVEHISESAFMQAPDGTATPYPGRVKRVRQDGVVWLTDADTGVLLADPRRLMGAR